MEYGLMNFDEIFEIMANSRVSIFLSHRIDGDHRRLGFKAVDLSTPEEFLLEADEADDPCHLGYSVPEGTWLPAAAHPKCEGLVRVVMRPNGPNSRPDFMTGRFIDICGRWAFRASQNGSYYQLDEIEGWRPVVPPLGKPGFEVHP